MGFSYSFGMFLNVHSLLFIFVLLPSVAPVYFNISSFDPGGSEFLCQGDAKPLSGAIEFNSISYRNQSGRVIYPKPVHLWDSFTREGSDFTTYFSFTIDTLNASVYGHGIAFFLAPTGFPIPTASTGGFLGLFNTATVNRRSIAQNQIVMVEFDTYSNPRWDPPTEHVGININSIGSAVYAEGWNASLHSGEIVNAWVTYSASANNLTVIWNFRADVLRNNYTLSHQVDMKEVLPQWVTVGFSAATGINIERNILHSWEFSSDFPDKATTKNQAGKVNLILGVVLPPVILIGIGMIACVIIQTKRYIAKEKSRQLSMDFETDGVPRRFTFRELASATNNFSIKKKLGQGGFGEVYRGFLGNLNIDVAVKKISRESKQGEKEYLAEVKIISQVRHRNLVQLLGWCHERGEFLIVYDFMPHGSLDSHLFGDRSQLLAWGVRYNIALGLASALVYLHEEREQCVVHRDIKPSNVMLDMEFNAKLGDFGLARLMEHNVGLKTTGLAGTIGYMSPEYITTGKASKESDVYSFGVVALEIVCGRRMIGVIEEESPVGLVQWVWTLYGKGQVFDVVDQRLCMEYDVNQMEYLITVGLWCAHPDHSLRPTMKQVIQVLNFQEALPTLPKNMPVLMYCEPSPWLASWRPSMTFGSIATGH